MDEARTRVSGPLAIVIMTAACGPGSLSGDGFDDATTSESAADTSGPETSSDTDAPETSSDTDEPEPFEYETVEVPAGPFMMGCAELVDPFCADWEFPAHEVFLDTFSIGTYEVTVAQYRACVEDGQCSVPGQCHWNTEGYEQHPINCVSWSQAAEFCAWINGRLPTEAEWEKAARSDDFRVYPWGDDPPSCAHVVSQNLCGGNGAAPVGTKPAGVSPYGAYDMLGNLQEWVSDWFAADWYEVSGDTNPIGPDSPTCCKVARGGQAAYVPEAFRASYRNYFGVDEWNGNQIGFRCLIE